MKPSSALLALVFVSAAACEGASTSGAREPPVAQAPAEDQPCIDAATAKLLFDVHVERGAAEFHARDDLRIERVLGSRPTLEPCGVYRVSGTYELGTASQASLVASVTTFRGEEGIITNGILGISKGRGSFSVDLQLPATGFPHIAINTVRGTIGGVYFGTGRWLLTHKDWKYDDPQEPKYFFQLLEGGER